MNGLGGFDPEFHSSLLQHFSGALEGSAALAAAVAQLWGEWESGHLGSHVGIC